MSGHTHAKKKQSIFVGFVFGLFFVVIYKLNIYIAYIYIFCFIVCAVW